MPLSTLVNTIISSQIPLFGLHHILLPFRPEADSPIEKYYHVTSAILISVQGICVSCLFCFANQDVLLAIKCFLNRLFPSMFTTYSENKGPPPTLTRDLVL